MEISKIINGRATATVYIYTVTVARIFLHNFRRTDWSIFEAKCVKIVFYMILEELMWML